MNSLKFDYQKKKLTTQGLILKSRKPSDDADADNK